MLTSPADARVGLPPRCGLLPIHGWKYRLTRIPTLLLFNRALPAALAISVCVPVRCPATMGARAGGRFRVRAARDTWNGKESRLSVFPGAAHNDLGSRLVANRLFAPNGETPGTGNRPCA